MKRGSKTHSGLALCPYALSPPHRGGPVRFCRRYLNKKTKEPLKIHSFFR